jgi:DNA-binding SARP family transcriptional activator
VSNTLPRPRLLNLLKKNTEKKLILILGRAAQGKSTLAASFLEQAGIPAAWVNLGPEESDPVNLFQIIVQALQQVLSGSEWASLLDFPSRTMGPRDPIGFYREWIRGLGEFISGPVFLALDGLDRLLPDSPAFSFLQVLLDESPPEFRLVLCSRQTPPGSFNYQSLKLRQQALVLSNEDLAFTRTEIRDFFNRTRKISLTAEPLGKIHQATEGWVGGLILLAETLKKNPDFPPDQYLGDGGLNRFRLEAFEYLGQEIFAAQSPEVQDLLVKSALIPFVDPDLMRGLAGVADAEGILKDFVRRNLFVQESYEPGRGWIFRFHQLFREFLLTRFEETVPEQEKADLYQRAALLFQNRGNLDEAVQLFLRANDLAAVAGIIRQIGLEMVAKGRTADLSKMLQALAEDSIRQDPWLLLLFSLTRRWSEMNENLNRFSRCLSLFEKKADIKGTLLTLAYLLEASNVCRAPWSSLLELFTKAEWWLAQGPPESYPEEKAHVWLNMGVNQVMSGNARKGYQDSRKAGHLARVLKNPILECQALGNSLKGLSILGEYGLAEELAQELEKLSGSIKDIDSKAWSYNALILFNIFSGNSLKAADNLSNARQLISENGLFYFNIMILSFEIFWEGFFGSLSEAEDKTQTVIGLAESLDNDFLKGNPRVMLGFAYYKSGRHEKAAELITRGIDYIASDRGYCESRLYGARLVQGLITYHRSGSQEIIGDLDEIIRYALTINNCILLIDTHLALAIIHWDQGNKPEAEKHVQVGLTLASEKKYFYSLLLSPNDVVKGCLLAFALGIEAVYPMARRILTDHHYAETAERELLKTEWHLSPGLQNEKQGLLRTIHYRKVPGLEITTLGGLQIVRNGVPIPDDSWVGQQPKRLLISLLCHPGGKALREILIEELWPLEITAKGENNFKVTLLRLRKSLEASIHPAFGSSYLHLHHNQVELSPEFIRIDTDEFLKFAGAGRRRESLGDTRGAMEEYGRMLEMYRGDFLPGENSLPGVDRRRLELKKAFIESLKRLAQLSEEAGSLKKAAGYYHRILEADPLTEEACQNLMRLCLTLRTYNEALRAFDSLKRNLEVELKSQPDPQTLNLHRQIRERINQE